MKRIGTFALTLLFVASLTASAAPRDTPPASPRLGERVARGIVRIIKKVGALGDGLTPPIGSPCTQNCP